MRVRLMELPLQGALLLLMFSQNLLAAQCTSHTNFLPHACLSEWYALNFHTSSRACVACDIHRECFVKRYKAGGLSSLKSIDIVKVTVTVLTISLYHYEPGLWLHLRGPFIRCIEHCMLNTNTMVVLKMYQINKFWTQVMNDQEPHIKSAIFIYSFKSNSFWRLLVITEKVWQSASTTYEWALARSEQCFVGLL